MLIIALGKFRAIIGRRNIRFDRTMPLPEKQSKQGVLYMECCDCGLIHFVVNKHSGTPIRPLKYNYKMRLGAKASNEPDESLREHVFIKWGQFTNRLPKSLNKYNDVSISCK